MDVSNSKRCVKLCPYAYSHVLYRTLGEHQASGKKVFTNITSRKYTTRKRDKMLYTTRRERCHKHAIHQCYKHTLPERESVINIHYQRESVINIHYWRESVINIHYQSVINIHYQRESVINIHYQCYKHTLLERKCYKHTLLERKCYKHTLPERDSIINVSTSFFFFFRLCNQVLKDRKKPSKNKLLCIYIA